MSRTLVALGVALAVLTACTGDDGVSSEDLRGRSFEVVRLGDLRLDSPELREDTTAFLDFGAEGLTIAGCNMPTGDYRIADGAFAFEVEASQDEDCSQIAPNLRPIIDLLESGPEIRLDEARLTFIADDGTTLVAVDELSTPT